MVVAAAALYPEAVLPLAAQCKELALAVVLSVVAAAEAVLLQHLPQCPIPMHQCPTLHQRQCLMPMNHH